jgi:hypothetical protein
MAGPEDVARRWRERRVAQSRRDVELETFPTTSGSKALLAHPMFGAGRGQSPQAPTVEDGGPPCVPCPWAWYKAEDLNAGNNNQVTRWRNRTCGAGPVTKDHNDRYVTQVDDGINGLPSVIRGNAGTFMPIYSTFDNFTEPVSTSWTFTALVKWVSAGVRWYLSSNVATRLDVRLEYDFEDGGDRWYAFSVESGVGWDRFANVKFNDAVDSKQVAVVVDAAAGELRVYGDGLLADVWGGGPAVFDHAGPFTAPDTDYLEFTVNGNETPVDGVGNTLLGEVRFYDEALTVACLP